MLSTSKLESTGIAAFSRWVHWIDCGMASRVASHLATVVIPWLADAWSVSLAIHEGCKRNTELEEWT